MMGHLGLGLGCFFHNAGVFCAWGKPMNYRANHIEELETQLIEAAVALVVRCPNAWSRIHRALAAVSEAGVVMLSREDLEDQDLPRLRLVPPNPPEHL